MSGPGQADPVRSVKGFACSRKLDARNAVGTPMRASAVHRLKRTFTARDESGPMTSASITMPEPELQRLPLQECAYALSVALAMFAAWAWLSSAGVWAAMTGLRDAMAPQAAGFILLAALSFIVQIAANVAAAAARQAQHAGLPKEFERARVLMILGGAYNAVSLHHAFALVGFMTGDMAFLIWPLAGALAFYEPAQYWIDEALAGARAERKARADAFERAELQAIRDRQDRADARRSASPGRADNVTSFPDVARKAALTAGAGAVALSGQAVATEPFQGLDRVHDGAVIMAHAHAGADLRVAQAMALKGRLTRAEAARKLRVSERTMTRLWKAGEDANRAALA